MGERKEKERKREERKGEERKRKVEREKLGAVKKCREVEEMMKEGIWMGFYKGRSGFDVWAEKIGKRTVEEGRRRALSGVRLCHNLW